MRHDVTFPNIHASSRLEAMAARIHNEDQDRGVLERLSGDERSLSEEDSDSKAKRPNRRASVSPIAPPMTARPLHWRACGSGARDQVSDRLASRSAKSSAPPRTRTHPVPAVIRNAQSCQNTIASDIGQGRAGQGMCGAMALRMCLTQRDA